MLITRASPPTAALVLIIMALLSGTAIACPAPCACKWRNGKQTVECTDRRLLTIPDGMDAGTQVLEFAGNNLGTLHRDKFLQLELINLQRIFLARCAIAVIDDRTFRGLSNLVELDLSENALAAIPSATFMDCPSLMRLSLSGNPIRVVRRAAFGHLSFLNTLELSRCEISRVEDAAFQGLHSLEWLRLDGNRLASLNGARVLPDNLRGVDLQANPWRCDCTVRPLHAWLTSLGQQQTSEPVCHEPPKFVGRAVKSIPSKELACLPDVAPTTFYLEVGEGKNISLACHVSAVPEADVSWWFHGHQLHNDTIVAPGYRLLYYVEDGAETKYSELFIYNTNVEDNGTFICSAENAAGTVQSNYTIRIIVHKEPIVVVVSIPIDYLLPAVIAGAVATVLLLCLFTIVLVKCGRKRRRRNEKRHKTKEVSLQNNGCNGNGVEINGSSTSNIAGGGNKCAVVREEINRSSGGEADDKYSCILDTTQQQQQQGVFYSAENLLRAMSPPAGALETAASMPNTASIAALTSYHHHLEQNPDLINDTERREADGEELSSINQPPPECMMKLFPLPSWHHVSSATAAAMYPALDAHGYPLDYGLPKSNTQPSPQPPPCNNVYRTLPHKRVSTAAATATKSSNAGGVRRFSRDVEFLCLRPVAPAVTATLAATPSSQYDHYCTDVRYTADGYPERSHEPQSLTLLPSPPEAYKNHQHYHLHHPRQFYQQQHHHQPAHLHPLGHQSALNRCAGNSFDSASTDTTAVVGGNNNDTIDIAAGAGSGDRQQGGSGDSHEAANEMPNESPDEGYEGEAAVVL